jgi:hypothetical protein
MLQRVEYQNAPILLTRGTRYTSPICQMDNERGFCHDITSIVAKSVRSRTENDQDTDEGSSAIEE